MLRVLGIMALFGACTFMGERAAGVLRSRHQALSALCADARRLAMLMEYAPKPLSSLCAGLNTGPAAELWQGFAKHLPYAPDTLFAWRAAMGEADGVLLTLSEQDRAILEDYARGLGGGSRETQKANARLLQERLSAAKQEAGEIYRAKGRMYRAMGVLCGVGLAVLVW